MQVSVFFCRFALHKKFKIAYKMQDFCRSSCQILHKAKYFTYRLKTSKRFYLCIHSGMSLDLSNQERQEYAFIMKATRLNLQLLFRIALALSIINLSLQLQYHYEECSSTFGDEECKQFANIRAINL